MPLLNVEIVTASYRTRFPSEGRRKLLTHIVNFQTDSTLLGDEFG